MGFSEEVKRKAFEACGRYCCLCHKYCGTKMEVHHIVQSAKSKDNTFENAIPLCFNCHSDMAPETTGHYKGNHFTPEELRHHRDHWYTLVKNGVGLYTTPISLLEINTTGTNNRKSIITGLKDFDEITLIVPESIVVITGKIKSGKTSLAKLMLIKNPNTSFLYLSLKDGKDHFVSSLLSGEACIKKESLQTGKLTDEEWQRLVFAGESLQKLQLDFEAFDITNNYSEQILYSLKTQDKDVYIIDDINALCLDEQEIEKFMYKVKQIQQQTKSIIVFLYHTNLDYNTNGIFSTPESIFRFSNYAYFISDHFENTPQCKSISLHIDHTDQALAVTNVLMCNQAVHEIVKETFNKNMGAIL